jgi:hypothetical protein
MERRGTPTQGETQMTFKATLIRDDVTGDIEGYDYRGVMIYRNDTAMNGGRYEVSKSIRGCRIPHSIHFLTKAEAMEYIDAR